MKRLMLCAAIAMMIAASLGAAQAATFDGVFPSASATVVASLGHMGSEVGYFWSVSRGDMVSDTYTGTGLDWVGGLDLAFNVTQNVLNSGSQVDWDVKVNGTTVGSWAWSEADGTGPVALSYTFASIYGGGTYDVAMFVTNEVPDGYGSIALGEDGRATLTSAVPEPSSILTLLAGLGSVAGAFKLRRK